MNIFSKSSLKKLNTCHPMLIELFNEVIKYHDCTIICGNRNKKTQNKYHKEGKSKLLYPYSKHNYVPSIAVDVAPYISGVGISYDKKQCYLFCGIVYTIAKQLNISLRMGADWNRNLNLNDQSFFDLVHFELNI